jgi:hypothetical protein
MEKGRKAAGREMAGRKIRVQHWLMDPKLPMNPNFFSRFSILLLPREKNITITFKNRRTGLKKLLLKWISPYEARK